MSNETVKARYRRLKDAHLCTSCGRSDRPLDPKSRFYCTPCRDTANAYLRDRRKTLLTKGICACGQPVKPGCKKCVSCFDLGKNYAQRNRQKLRQQSADRYRRARDVCFTHYGRECACCAEPNPEFLQIDHVGGGGRAHAKSGAKSIFYWLRSHKFPSGFQTLCANCNWAKRTGSECPLRHTTCKIKRESLHLTPHVPQVCSSEGIG